MNVDKALQVLEQDTPLVVDRDKLEVSGVADVFLISASVDCMCDSSALLPRFRRRCWKER